MDYSNLTNAQLDEAEKDIAREQKRRKALRLHRAEGTLIVTPKVVSYFVTNQLTKEEIFKAAQIALMGEATELHVSVDSQTIKTNLVDSLKDIPAEWLTAIPYGIPIDNENMTVEDFLKRDK